MIDLNLFDLKRLVLTLVDGYDGNDNRWRALCFIEKVDMKRSVDGPTRPGWRVGVRLRESGNVCSYLRHSLGPRQGHFWDIYGNDYMTPELAFMALLQAPIPPGLYRDELWKMMAEETKDVDKSDLFRMKEAKP